MSMFSWQRTSGSHACDQKDRVPAFDRQLDTVRRGESEALGLLSRQFLGFSGRVEGCPRA